MKRQLNALVIGTVAATALAITIDAGIASAHTPAVSAACKNNVPTGSAGFTQYNGTGNQNTIQIYDDGNKIVDTTFGAMFPTTDYNLGSPTETHTFRVKVVAFDDPQYNFDQTLNVPVCQAATTTTTSTTTTTTPPSSTSTVPPTTAPATTAPATTEPATTAPTTTVPEETTTTLAAVAAETPTTPPTTAAVAVAPPVPETPPAGLPETGASTTTAMLLGGLGLAVGTTLLALRRRRVNT